MLFLSDYTAICPLWTKLLPGGSIFGTSAGWVCCQGGCLSFPHWLGDQVVRQAAGAYDVGWYVRRMRRIFEDMVGGRDKVGSPSGAE